MTTAKTTMVTNDNASIYYNHVDEGTFAHKLAELHLRWYLGQMHEEQYRAEYSELQQNIYYKPSMDKYVYRYVRYVTESVNMARERSPEAVVFIERELNHNEYGRGIADAIIISDGIIEIIDLKYGWKPIKAKNNNQLLRYAVGAVDEFKEQFNIHTVALTIVQPRISGEPDTHTMGIDELYEWLNAGGIHQTPTKDTLQLLNRELPKPSELEIAEVVDVISDVKRIRKWLDDVEQYATELSTVRGMQLDGLKLVYSSYRSKYTDEQQIINRLSQYEDVDLDVVAPRKPLSITKMKQVLGEEEFSEKLGSLVQRKAGRLVVVPKDDRRPEVIRNDY